MGTMHKEVIERKKASTIVVSIIVLCLMIVLSNYNQAVVIYNQQVSIFINIFIIVLTIAFGILQVVRCRTYYKYSIVADKLIIHKVKSTGQITLENIKITDIVYLGKIISSPKKYPISSTRLYVCNILGLKTYCCIYKDTHKYKKFYFQPSGDLINKLGSHGIRQKEILVV
ncbi:hypothetical protein [Clostridium folliculivorans]|uniref:Uncharacterized protein n=1 Tax=Clostridium folliculivorans TaxID=2886038 RepID=A0A9W5Y6Y6_9CLOT|nr:hypothetical protein [Clostridium folliculivorans]GKU27725.1 hypothetical protein CFOLD11_45520 [Clostridium folliculivorans]GKU32525.1 hypothetical protein CFB3_46330 [Clostridium folliculivorans]